MGTKMELGYVGVVQTVVLIEMKKDETRNDIFRKLKEKCQDNPEALAAVEVMYVEAIKSDVLLDEPFVRKDYTLVFDLYPLNQEEEK
jgi:sporulation protein YlmC with PRC-barrel domain